MPVGRIRSRVMEISERPANAKPWGDADTPFAEIGGEAPIRTLVERFYDEIEATSPVLRDMLPRDTSVSRQKLFEYLVGWTGGPPLYVQKHGHPRLRMRHLPFRIDESAAREWMRCMTVALDETVAALPLRDFLTVQMAGVAAHMINTDG